MPKATTRTKPSFPSAEEIAALEESAPEAVDPAQETIVVQEVPASEEVHEAPANETPAEVTPVKKERTRRKAPAPTMQNSLFAPLADVKEFLRILYWGREGSAKTTNSLTLANKGRLLVINAEGGLKKKTLARRGINVDNIQIWPQPGNKVTHAGLIEVYNEIKANLAQDPDSWVGVLFDSATDIVQSLVDNVTDDRVGKARARDVKIDEFDQFFVDRSDYGTMSKMFRDVLRKFRDLPCHVIITALERRDEDEDTGKVMYGPAVSPAIQTDLLGYVDIVLHTKEADDDADYYRALSKRAGKYRTKDRLGDLPKVMVDPTIERILAYIDEEIIEDKDPLQEPVREANRRREALAAERAAKKKAAPRRTARKTTAKPAADAAAEEPTE